MKKIRKLPAAISAQEPGRQYAALPYRDKGGLEILLLTSRETRRWVIPKGWPMAGKAPHDAAAQEAVEEAGVVGHVSKKTIGEFHYVKRLKNGAPLECAVTVFPLKVAKQLTRWPEQKQRTAHWFAAEEASELVEEFELGALILAFADAHARALKKKKAKVRSSVAADEIQLAPPADDP
jgi:8-oxo-dGTP pyrophosphatase MutT (NUDIX family)